jgi:PPM family protein phosphatase
MTLALRYAVRSDVGLLREGNEDSAYAGPHLLAVADGMGGYEAGEVASAAVISTVAPLDRGAMPQSELIDALSGAVSTAKLALRKIVEADPAVGSMGTTLTAMLWAGGSAAICHIGDSRAYLLRGGDLYQITRDHTFVQALIDQGRIRPEEAATHPQRSLLLRALDGKSDADPDLSMLAAQEGDRYLICSDGLPVAVSDEMILQALAENAEPTDAVLKLIDLALAGGGPDNITCIVADVIDPDRSHIAPTRTPVFAGAAASAGGEPQDTSTKPFTRPAFDESGMTRVGTVPATASHPRDTIPGLQANGFADSSSQTGPRAARAAQTAAATAAGGRQDDGEAGAVPRRRRRRPVMTSILVVFVLLVAGALFAFYRSTQNQYYVGTVNGKVAIYRGPDQSVLGMSWNSVFTTTDIPTAQVPGADMQHIRADPTGTLAQAQQFVANIRTDVKNCQASYAALRSWIAHKPKPQRKTFRVNGKNVTRVVTPHYKPKPQILAGCPSEPT